MRIAFLHPDLGIGGAERLVVDAALGLQNLGHEVHIYTSHHDPSHCFEETRDGTLKVHAIHSPIPRAIQGRFHILLAHLRQLHLTTHILSRSEAPYDVYFVDQLSTCVPFLRILGKARVVFYCHFPDKLLANGELVEEKGGRDGEVRFRMKKKGSLLKRAYRYPMDWLEEITTRHADRILANSKFTSRVFKTYFPSIMQEPTVVYPGINIQAYTPEINPSDSDIVAIASNRPTLLSLNRFERKKNAELAVNTFAKLCSRIKEHSQSMRLVLAGGYDPRLEDNVQTLKHLIDAVKYTHRLSYSVLTPSSSSVTPPPSTASTADADIIFLLNFTTAQRTALLRSSSTLCLLYTPANEHFGIGPVEGMICGVPVLACDSGGPVESLIESPASERTGWLRPPDPLLWTNAVEEIVSMSDAERKALGERGRRRAREVFGMEAMARAIERELEVAVSMGKIEDGEMLRVIVAISIGLIIAFFISPLVF
ncbi:glycosyltransferase family 4 protein [Moniliophthora roreri MCA 2997]|uniref:Alpha-1,3/1,6-mannosyltransferase ALG2 n=2 Tax=Moniliophthora roreri TaxID=221103 RepID=V2X9J6_MONRO|nr:glycosyltransferase family 4 protein [Moniliophthora roreri MCA 2997]KAI3615896.1 glycosyltransferase family 4 protein [Moniliophthora roreri]